MEGGAEEVAEDLEVGSIHYQGFLEVKKETTVKAAITVVSRVISQENAENLRRALDLPEIFNLDALSAMRLAIRK